jgi:hypothetical protein
MKKEDIYKSISEMARVTAPGGLIYFNLLSTEDSFFGEGKQIESWGIRAGRARWHNNSIHTLRKRNATTYFQSLSLYARTSGKAPSSMMRTVRSW